MTGLGNFWKCLGNLFSFKCSKHFRGLLVFGKILNLLWRNTCYLFVQIFIAVNGQILNKLCSHLVTLHRRYVGLTEPTFCPYLLTFRSSSLYLLEGIEICFSFSWQASLICSNTSYSLSPSAAGRCVGIKAINMHIRYHTYVWPAPARRLQFKCADCSS